MWIFHLFAPLNNIVCSFCCCSVFLFSSLLKPHMWWNSETQFCVSCDCSARGSVSPQCDITGRCICKSGFLGKQCHLRRQLHQQKEQSRKIQQVLGSSLRWGFTTSSGCPRGAYRPAAPVIQEALHDLCLCMLCSVWSDDLPWWHFTK